MMKQKWRTYFFKKRWNEKVKTTVQSYFQQLFIVQPTQSNTPLLPLQALRACFPDPIFAARILVPSSDTHWGKHRKAHSERNPLDRLIWIELGPSVPHVFGGIKTRDSSCCCHLRTASERQGSLLTCHALTKSSEVSCCVDSIFGSEVRARWRSLKRKCPGRLCRLWRFSKNSFDGAGLMLLLRSCLACWSRCLPVCEFVGSVLLSTGRLHPYSLQGIMWKRLCLEINEV